MRRFIFIYLLTIPLSIVAQERDFVMENNVAINYSMKEWKLNTSIGSRTIWEKKQSGVKNQKLGFLEINQFLTRTIAHNKTASLGYKYRSVDPVESETSYEHRLTGQLAWTHNTKNKTRIISRFRYERRIGSESNRSRFRYRLSLDVPLSGDELDVKEFYFAGSNESLFELESTKGEWENRVTFGLGYQLTFLTKAQIDLTYRTEDLGGQNTNVPFVTTNLIFRLHK